MKRLLLASLAGLVLAPAVHAANLFSDPGFDEGTGPWVADSGTNAFRESTDDFAGNVNSGSLALATSDGQNADLAARACVAVSPSASYDFSTGVHLVTASEAGMQCDAFAADDCSGASIATAVAEGQIGSGWSTIGASNFVVPAEAHSVSCALGTVQPLRPARPSQPGGFIAATRFDNVVFQLTGTPVTLQGFDVQ